MQMIHMTVGCILQLLEISTVFITVYISRVCIPRVCIPRAGRHTKKYATSNMSRKTVLATVA
jgi:hypothetical protein